MDAFPDTDGPLERRRLGLFVTFAFGIAWATAGYIYASGGLTDSPTVVEAGPLSLTLAGILLPTAYMFAPGIANVLTRVLTREGWDDLGLSVGFFDHWRAYVAAWFAPGVLTALGAALYFAVFPQYFDPAAESFASAAAGGADVGMSPLALVALTVGAAVVINPLVNAVFGFGEEFGWRAYLLPKLAPLGLQGAVVVQGLIWGAWHWPLIAMGYEYGFDYGGFPWVGFVVFLAFALAAGTFLAWLTLRTGSVWPASLGHGAINATAVVAVVFARGDPDYLLGPLPMGVVSVLPWLALAGYLLSRMEDGAPAARSTSGVPPASSADE
ncbi:CPBP family intramembrane glutamic endopeptidase [Halomicrobium zhouii]|nr:CPBP family intramembrane glutamic endopeptidase [Halomicrobium zhouii]